MSLLPLHIIAGITGIISGFVAVFALKGARLHRKSGIVFVYAMVILAATGATIAFLKHQTGNVIGGSLTLYLVITALRTVRPLGLQRGPIDVAAMFMAITLGLLSIKVGLDGLHSATGTVNGVPPAMIFFFAGVALLAGAGDLRVVVAGELKGAQRIARHLWRMCFALFVASGSFFLGQAKVFPKPMRIYPLLAIPALLPLALMLYWLVRVLFTKWYRRRASESFKTMPLRGAA